MHIPSIHRALAFSLLLAIGAVQARDIAIGADRLVAAGVHIERFELRIEGGGSPRATLSMEQLDAPALGPPARLDWTCDLRAEPGGGMSCDGPIRFGERMGDLALHVDAGAASIELARGETRIGVVLPFDPARPVLVDAGRVPAEWLRDLLRASWPGGEWRDGVADIDAKLARDGGIEAGFAFDGLALAGSDGAASVEGVAARGHVSIEAARERRIAVDARLTAGTVRVGELDIEVPPTAIDASLDATLRGDGVVDVARFAWRDAGTLEFEAAGQLEPAALAPLRRLSVTQARLGFPQVRERYADTLFRRYGMATLDLRGTVHGSVEVDPRGLRRLALDTDALDLRDDARTWRIDRLVGGIDWRAEGAGETKRIGWRRAAVAASTIGAVHSDWRSRDGRFELASPLRIDVGHGRLELIDTVVAPLADGGERLRTRFLVRDFSHGSPDGTIAVEGLAASGSLSLADLDTQPRLRAEARIDGGEVLYGSVYVRLPSKRIDARVDATFATDRLQIAQFAWSDPGTLELSAGADVRVGAAPAIESLRADLRRLDLATALPRYAASWLAAKGWPDLSGRGAVSGGIRIASSGLQAFSLAAADVSLTDGGGRLALDGLDGTLDWSADGERDPTTLGWRHLDVLQVPFGPARAEFVSRGAALELVRPLAVDVFGGQLRLERFTAQPRSPSGERYAGSFALAGLQMPRISEAFGWPLFPGNLSGGVPEIEFAGDRIEFHGGLDLYVFDGHLGVSGLALERPFGVAPALRADVHFENMDLEQLTRAFSFGGMSGRLFGTIAGLRLVDWSPIAFDAWLRTDGGGRMSYKAVDDLTSLGGGGGLGAGLQAMALKVFDTFGYRRLGLRCKLEDDVCSMGGIEPVQADSGDSPTAGYTIVEGSGIPRIMIVGHRRRVDWPTLVRRLGEATSGQGPVIE